MHWDIVRLLLVHGADIKSCRTLLADTLDADQDAIAAFLIENGADTNHISRNGQKPIQIAATKGKSDIYRLLVDHGAKQGGLASGGGLVSTKQLSSISGTEMLSDNPSPKPTAFFFIGRVFRASLPWTSRQASGDTGGEEHNNELAFTTGRYLVIDQGSTACSAVPIREYGDVGAGMPGLDIRYYAMIYSGGTLPDLSNWEITSGASRGMSLFPYRLELDTGVRKLQRISRIDFRSVHSVPYSTPATSIGSLSGHSIAFLQWRKSFVEVIDPVSSGVKVYCTLCRTPFHGDQRVASACSTGHQFHPGCLGIYHAAITQEVTAAVQPPSICPGCWVQIRQEHLNPTAPTAMLTRVRM
jgi:hypothetical protein